MQLPPVIEIYIMCTMFGTLALLASAVLGGFAHAHGAHGHSPAGHGQGHALGHGHAAGHGHSLTAHAHIGGHGHSATTHASPAGAHGARGGPQAGHALRGGGQARSAAPAAHTAGGHAQGRISAGARSGAQTNAAAGQTGTAEGNAVVPATSTTTVLSSPDESAIAKVLVLINPTTISSFAVWFGATGLIMWRLLPFLDPALSLPVALTGGVLATRATLTVIGALASRLHQSGSFSQESLIGLQAEITVPVNAGRTGELTCIAGGPRYTLSARALNPEAAFRRGALVIIADVKDDVAYIEPWPDDFAITVEDSQTLTAAPPQQQEQG